MTHHPENTQAGMAHGTAQPAAHGPSIGALLLVYVGLLALTGLTVSLAGVDLGRWIIISALGIASAKTIMVGNTFMHLKFEDPILRVFVGVAVLTLAIFIILTFFDYAF